MAVLTDCKFPARHPTTRRSEAGLCLPGTELSEFIAGVFIEAAGTGSSPGAPAQSSAKGLPGKE